MKGDRQKKAAADLVTREYTANLNKRLHGITFKKRAPRAARRPRAPQVWEQTMKTKDVRLDTKLNKYLWSKGVRNAPFRVRVRLARKRNEDEEADEKASQRGSIVVVGSRRRTENGRHGGAAVDPVCATGRTATSVYCVAIRGSLGAGERGGFFCVICGSESVTAHCSC